MSSIPSGPDEATDLLPRAVPVAQGIRSDDLAPGTQLGAYVILAKLGEGGMGHVYLAEQLRPVQRKVALKLIRTQIASPLAQAWFEVERQALAQMHHPSIAQVFDAGTTADGHPYLAMEWVEGATLTHYCKEHSLDRVARIHLFERICQGVQHAHQKGIIHRDLKPSNVLVREVDGAALPVLIDFGIAIGGNAAPQPDVAASVHTDERVGTSAYMSPEQAAFGGRDLDTRSDVYALGVMLCELLTGCDAATLTSDPHASRQTVQATLLAAVASDAPSSKAADAHALLTAARELPADLRAILRKALAIDREQRYPSAIALADDLERYRLKRPLKAIAPTRWYLARTFIARHRFGLAAVVVVAAALVAGILLALHGRNAARESERVARIEANKAAQVSEFVRGIFEGIDPETAKGMDRTLIRQLLDSAAQRADQELAQQPAVRAEIETTIAESYGAIGEPTLSAQHYVAAIDAAKAAGLGALELARLLDKAAHNLDAQGRNKEALERAQQAFALVQALPEDNGDRLQVESTLAGAEYSTGAANQAQERYERVLAAQRRKFGPDSDEVLSTLNRMMVVYSETNQLDKARSLQEDLVARTRARFGNEDPKTLMMMDGLAIVLAQQEHFAEAEAMVKPNLPIYERVFGKDHPLTYRLVSNLGVFIRQQGRNEEARPYYERSLALATKLYGADNRGTISAEGNLALLLRDVGDLAGAERHARIAATKADAAFGDNPMRAVNFSAYASILIRLKRYPEAAAQLDHAWQVFSTAEGFGAAHPRAQYVVDTAIELYTAWPHPDRLAMWKARKTK